MASPLQYQSQFIPTNVGFINSLLQERQGEYDQAYNNLLQSQQQLGLLNVGSEDAPFKQQRLTQLIEDVNQIADKYNGDFGAASKSIARRLSQARTDPFWQTALRNQQIREEERQLRNKLGLKALPISSALGQSTIDPATGKVRDLSYDVIDREDLAELALEPYAPIRTRRNTSMEASQFGPGFVDKVTTVGATRDEAAAYMPEIKRRILELKPELANSSVDLDQYAYNVSQKLIGGTQRDPMADPRYKEGYNEFRTPEGNYISGVAFKQPDLDIKGKYLEKLVPGITAEAGKNRYLNALTAIGSYNPVTDSPAKVVAALVNLSRSVPKSVVTGVTKSTKFPADIKPEDIDTFSEEYKAAEKLVEVSKELGVHPKDYFEAYNKDWNPVYQYPNTEKGIELQKDQAEVFFDPSNRSGIYKSFKVISPDGKYQGDESTEKFFKKELNIDSEDFENLKEAGLIKLNPLEPNNIYSPIAYYADYGGKNFIIYQDPQDPALKRNLQTPQGDYAYNRWKLYKEARENLKGTYTDTRGNTMDYIYDPINDDVKPVQ